MPTIPRLEKISPAFAARLEGLTETDKVRVLVILATPDPTGPPIVGLTSPRQRRVIADGVRGYARRSLRRLKPHLRKYRVRILCEEPDSLAQIPVEASPQAIRALALSPQVQAILEDQPMRLVK